MGKLLGLPMGCDACFTYHARMSQDELESLKVLLGAAGCTLPHVAAGRRRHHAELPVDELPRHPDACARLLGKRPTPEFDAWLVERGHLATATARARGSATPEVLR